MVRDAVLSASQWVTAADWQTVSSKGVSHVCSGEEIMMFCSLSATTGNLKSCFLLCSDNPSPAVASAIPSCRVKVASCSCRDSRDRDGSGD